MSVAHRLGQVLGLGEAQAHDLAAELDGQRVAQRSLPNELQDHPGEQPQGHQTLIHPTLRIERGQLPELTGQKLG
jgi:hypothetical protein